MFIRSFSFTFIACSAALVASFFAGSSSSANTSAEAVPSVSRTHLIRAGWQQAAGTPLSATASEDLYQDKCSMCHGADRAGHPPSLPSLIGVSTRYSDAEITKQIRNGKGKMPANPGLSDDEVKALVLLLKTAPASSASPGV